MAPLTLVYTPFAARLARPPLARPRPDTAPPAPVGDRARRADAAPRMSRTMRLSSYPRRRRAGGLSIRWLAFLDEGLDGYAEYPRPARPVGGTSRMSEHTSSFGEIHPRTMLAGMVGTRLEGRRGVPHRARLARVLRGRALAPSRQRAGVPAVREYARMRYSSPERPLEAWRAGQTGFPPGGRRDAPAAAGGGGCTTACGWSPPASSSRTCT